MLVLSRQRDEAINIGDDVEICIVDIRGDKTRLGINAPKHISVHRKEVYDIWRKEFELLTQYGPADGSGLEQFIKGYTDQGWEIMKVEWPQLEGKSIPQFICSFKRKKKTNEAANK